MSNENQNDPELMAMSKAFEALRVLEPAAISRVIIWLANKFGTKLEKPTDVLNPPLSNANGNIREGTINTVAVRMGVKSCKDLMIAAAVHLTIYQGKERFSRAEWVACAKESKQWKTDYSVQTSTQVSRLLSSGFVNETAKDIYVVPDEQLKAHSVNLE
jgi:hypothetical protein